MLRFAQHDSGRDASGTYLWDTTLGRTKIEEQGMNNLFWGFAVVWVLHIGYLFSLAVRQNGLRREIATLKALIEQKGQTPVGR